MFRLQIDRVSGIAAKYVEELVTSYLSMPSEADKPIIVELAVAAMEELTRLAQSGEPLWVSRDHSMEILNEDEYLWTFPMGIGPKPSGLKTETSKESTMVIMSHLKLVAILMDVVIKC